MKTSTRFVKIETRKSLYHYTISTNQGLSQVTNSNPPLRVRAPNYVVQDAWELSGISIHYRQDYRICRVCKVII